MRDFRSIEKRLADQLEARARLVERARLIKSRNTAKTANTARQKPQVAPPAQIDEVHPKAPAAKTSAGSAPFMLQARDTIERVRLQPWAKELVDTLLDAAREPSVTLCLIWPAKLTSLPLIHALANLERQFEKDLRGFRTLLYPANYAFRGALHSHLVGKTELSELFRSLWTVENGTVVDQSKTSSQSFNAALSAVNNIRIHHPELTNPSLAELVPTFIFDPHQHEWRTPVTSPLESTLSKVPRLVNRSELRKKVSSEWTVPDKAPAALMAIHFTGKKKAWRQALLSSALRKTGKPDVMLFDATTAAARKSYSSVRRIPEYLKLARDSGLSQSGAVILTDDPRTYFNMQAQLAACGPITFKAMAAESDHVLLSPCPRESNWTPSQRSNTFFNVGIVDQEASRLALTFQHLMSSSGNEDSPEYQLLLQAFLYVLRLSNMPAGFTDLIGASADSVGQEYTQSLHAWAPIRLSLLNALDSGLFNQSRTSTEQAIERADKLIENWNDATPMAARLYAEIKKHFRAGHHPFAIVLPNRFYILLASRFLERMFGDDWPLVERKLEWHALGTLSKTLTDKSKSAAFALIGVSPDVVRLLLTHLDIPHGTLVLMAYRQADSLLWTLKGMKGIDAFKAYRGRIGLLIQEIQRRLDEIPNPVAIGKLREFSMLFTPGEQHNERPGPDASYYTFELEDHARTYSSGWVYRYEHDEEPCFRRSAASAIQPGDFIFNLNEDLRAKLESALMLESKTVTSVVDPVRMLLKLYHDDVQTRCRLLFNAVRRSALAREIHASMVRLDPQAHHCRIGRVYYWLAPLTKNGTRPHASIDAQYFRVFCKALGMSDDTAEQHWNFIKNARRMNQSLGRELAARYAEILFQPESAVIYRKVPAETLRMLQEDALNCVARVERVIPPSTCIATS